MKKTNKNIVANGITIDKVNTYTEYVATLKLKKGDKVVNKNIIFMKTEKGLVALKGYDESHKIYGEPNKLKISEHNNSIRLATQEDFKDFSKRLKIVSRA